MADPVPDPFAVVNTAYGIDENELRDGMAVAATWWRQCGSSHPILPEPVRGFVMSLLELVNVLESNNLERRTR